MSQLPSSPKIKIAFFTDDIDRKTKGQAVVSLNLIKELAKSHADKIELVLVHRQGKGESEVKNLGRDLTIKTFHLPFASGLASWLWFFLTVRERFDIFYCPRHNIYPGFFLAKWRGKVKKFVVLLHGAPDHLTPKFFRSAGAWWNWHVKYFARFFVDKFLAVSKNAMTQIHDYYNIPYKKIDFFYISCHANFKPLPEDEKEAKRRILEESYGIQFPYILQVGRFDPHKNVHGLIKAFKALIQDPDFRHYLVLAGGRHLAGYSKQIDDLIQKFGLNGRIIITKDILAEDMPAMYSLADLSISVSLNEGFGLPLVEAMNMAVPQVLADTPVYREVAGEAAYFVDPLDSDIIAQGIKRVLNNARLRDNLRAKGLKRAGFFSWQKAAEKFAGILGKTLTE